MRYVNDLLYLGLRATSATGLISIPLKASLNPHCSELPDVPKRQGAHARVLLADASALFLWGLGPDFLGASKIT